MKKALRIGYNRYYDDNIFQEHLEYVKRNLEFIDEITLIVEFSHYGYWPLDFCRNSAKILENRISQYRAVGVKSIGINVMCTIGHTEEGWEVLPKSDLQYIVGENGVESRACLCPSNDDFLEYISERYALFAKAGANFVWFDDDVRFDNHGVSRKGCYCKKCIEKFNNLNNTNFNREELVDAIKADANLLQKWNGFYDDSIVNLSKIIGESIRNANANVKVGAMTSFATKNVSSLLEASKAEIGRPGGGFYKDDKPTEVLEKCFFVKNQISQYPKRIADIQYEYEAFNYQNLNRSMQLSDIEVNLAVMAGCNGVLFNNDIFNDREDIMNLFKQRKNMWDKLGKNTANSFLTGVFCFNNFIASQLCQIGIPVTTDKNHAIAFAIFGEEWNLLKDDEINGILENPVFTDGKGLDALCKRGFEQKCGGNVKNIYATGFAERFGTSELNGEFKNYYRDVFTRFFGGWPSGEGDAYELNPADGAETMANIETITHIKKGCAMYLYNDKFVADGYFMPKSLFSSAKREQLINVFDKITNFSLPVKIKKPLRVAPLVSADGNGKTNIMLVNFSLDATESFECEIRSGGKFYQLSKSGELLPLPQRNHNGNTVVTVDNIERTDYIILTDITD